MSYTVQNGILRGSLREELSLRNRSDGCVIRVKKRREYEEVKFSEIFLARWLKSVEELEMPDFDIFYC